MLGRNLDWRPEDVLAQTSCVIRSFRDGRLAFVNAGWPGAIGERIGVGDVETSLSCEMQDTIDVPEYHVPKRPVANISLYRLDGRAKCRTRRSPANKSQLTIDLCEHLDDGCGDEPCRAGHEYALARQPREHPVAPPSPASGFRVGGMTDRILQLEMRAVRHRVRQNRTCHRT